MKAYNEFWHNHKKLSQIGTLVLKLEGWLGVTQVQKGG